MREMTYFIVCMFLENISLVIHENFTGCQLVIRTNVDLGETEQQFYRNMGLGIFKQIFENRLKSTGSDIVSAYNALTGRITNSDENLSMRIKDIQESIPEAKLRLQERERNALEQRVKEIDMELSNLELQIAKTQNASRAAQSRGESNAKYERELEALYHASSIKEEEKRDLMARHGVYAEPESTPKPKPRIPRENIPREDIPTVPATPVATAIEGALGEERRLRDNLEAHDISRDEAENPEKAKQNEMDNLVSQTVSKFKQEALKLVTDGREGYNEHGKKILSVLYKLFNVDTNRIYHTDCF